MLFQPEKNIRPIFASAKQIRKSTLAEINGGELTISLSGKEADGIDSNGDLVIRGGTLAISGELAIDIVGDIRFTGGTVIFNGKEQTDLKSINSAGN